MSSLHVLTAWGAILHICQIAEFLTLKEEEARVFLKWLARQFDHKRPFIRAWSLNAAFVVGMQFKALEGEALRALDRAEADAAASVRARGRHMRKTLSG